MFTIYLSTWKNRKIRNEEKSQNRKVPYKQPRPKKKTAIARPCVMSPCSGPIKPLY
jgi:hypothetical protein